MNVSIGCRWEIRSRQLEDIHLFFCEPLVWPLLRGKYALNVCAFKSCDLSWNCVWPQRAAMRIYACYILTSSILLYMADIYIGRTRWKAHHKVQGDLPRSRGEGGRYPSHRWVAVISVSKPDYRNVRSALVLNDCITPIALFPIRHG